METKNVQNCESGSWKKIMMYSEGLATVKDMNGKWGFIDKSGKLVIPCKWKAAGEFR